MDLNELRDRIDEIDSRIVRLISTGWKSSNSQNIKRRAASPCVQRERENSRV